MKDSGCTSLRVHLGSLLASGPALALVLNLPVKCGSRTPGLEFRCRIVSRQAGYCVSWVPLGVERVTCMTAACLKTLALMEERGADVMLVWCGIQSKMALYSFMLGTR